MNKRQVQQLRTINEALVLLAELPDTPALAGLRRAREALVRRVETLGELRLRQSMTRSGPTNAAHEIEHMKHRLRRGHLIPAARGAKRLFKHEPAILQVLRLPPASAPASRHAEAGLAIAKTLCPHGKFCHESGFRRGFLTDLRAASEQLREG
jgi:hypothetical protein